MRSAWHEGQRVATGDESVGERVRSRRIRRRGRRALAPGQRGKLVAASEHQGADAGEGAWLELDGGYSGDTRGCLFDTKDEGLE